MFQLNLRVGGLIAIVAGALSAGAAFAQPRPTLLIHITNHRHVALVELHATAVGKSSARTLSKALPPGGHEIVNFRRRNKCIFELHATYEDGTFTDFHHFDLCRDETINLVD